MDNQINFLMECISFALVWFVPITIPILAIVYGRNNLSNRNKTLLIYILIVIGWILSMVVHFKNQ